MIIKVNPRRIAKYLIIFASIFLIFPFLVVLGYYLRMYIEKRTNKELIRPIETTDKDTIARETGTVVI